MVATTPPSPTGTPPPLPRPYTSYHLFFQLEREYILQSLLGHRPASPVPPNSPFDASNRSSYRGPPLPPRYDGLVLPRDWHVPGKSRRRKRVHRRSHGKIGFRELNERISEAWSVADGDVRGYCARLAAIQLGEYRKAKAEIKAVAARRRSSEALEHKAPEVKTPVDSICSKDPVAGDDLDCGRMSPSIRRMVSQESIRGGEEEGARSPLAEVSIEDSEIVDMWKRTRAHPLAVEEGWTRSPPPVPPLLRLPSPPVPALCGICAEIPNIPSPPLADEGEGVSRSSFIDAEYERFKLIGRRFGTARRGSMPDKSEKRMSSSAPQA